MNRTRIDQYQQWQDVHQQRASKKARWMMVICGGFVALGFAVTILGGHYVGLMAVAFFGGCFCVGIHEVRHESSTAASTAMICGLALMAVGCLTWSLSVILPPEVTQIRSWRGGPGTAGIVGAFGAVFFGFGAVILAFTRRRLKRR